MAAHKGHAKAGGRKAGTPNKTTAFTKSIINDLLTSYTESGLMAKDFKDLEPKDRLAIAEKLMQYSIPKMQSTAVDLNTNDKATTIEEKLSKLAQEND